MNDTERAATLQKVSEMLMDTIMSHASNDLSLAIVALGTVAGSLAAAADNPGGVKGLLMETVDGMITGDLLT